MSNSFLPSASLSMLRRRAELLARLRAFFTERGFLEVETPLLSRDTVVDRHLDPIETESPLSADGASRWFLQTSPEFAMKRLLAAGAEAIFQVTRAFRQGEQGRFHNPEFTMVEWYRRGDDLAAAMNLLGEVAEAMLGAGAVERLSYAAAFRQQVGIDPHTATVGDLALAAHERKVAVPDSLGEDRDAWLDLLLVELVEPHLGQRVPTLLYDYPASQAALAIVRQDDPPVAERFELYFQGLELANGYHELLDAAVLRQRQQANNALRVADAKQPLPEENRLLAAMEAGLPAASGVALGFDRLAMLALGASSLAEVLAFPIDRA